MKVEAWLVLKAKPGYGTYHSGPYQGQTRIGGIRVTKVTANKPTLAEDEIAFKMELDVDEGHFLSGTSTIKATVPPPDPSDEIDAVVDMPVRGRGKSSAAAVLKP